MLRKRIVRVNRISRLVRTSGGGGGGGPTPPTTDVGGFFWFRGPVRLRGK